MAITIRPADLDVDREVLIDLMLRYLTPRSTERKFDWLYRENPDGPAKAWVAIDTDRKEIVGSGAAVPRRMYVGGEEHLGCVLADFWIHPQYRSLGPAVQLQRACLEGVNSGEFTLCYDLPQSNMGAVYKRLGIASQENLLRLMKPLRVDKKIGEFVKFAPLVQGLSVLGNHWLAWGDRGLGGESQCMISVHQGAYGEEFSLLARQESAQYGVCVRRSAEYLNWRYDNHYFLRYETLTARLHDDLRAYVVFATTEEYTQIVDLFGIDEPEVISDLVAAVVFRLRQRGMLGVSVPLLSSHRWVGLFEQLGFRARESYPLITYVSPSAAIPVNSLERPRWFLTYGDLDP